MRRIRAAMLLSGLLVSPVLADSPAGERPAFCQPGWVCLRTKDAADLLIKVDMLQEQNAILKSKKAHALGWAAVCGPAASFSTTESGTTLAGTISCTIGFGYRF